jgi:phosphonate transport system substrate-binding protein
LAAARRAWRLIAILLLASLAAPTLSAGDDPALFRLGIVNERLDQPDHAFALYGSLQHYLDHHLLAHGFAGAQLVVAPDLADMRRRVTDGEVDALIEGVMPTLAIVERTDRLRPELLAWRKGQREYHSVFFVAADSPITHLRDLAGKTLAFESPRSTSAYFVPRAALREAGLRSRPADDASARLLAESAPAAPTTADEADSPDAVRFVFAGSELNQAYWVQRGGADAGAFNDGDWERVPERLRGQLRIIHRTRPLLRWLLSLNRDLPADQRAAVIAVLSGMHQNAVGQAALEQAGRIARFEPLSAADRDSLAYWAGVQRLLD